MQSGENIQGLRRILDLTRFISILLLLIHFYSACYPAFTTWGWTWSFLDTLLFNFTTNLFFLRGITPPKLASLLLLTVSLLGSKGRKSEKQALAPTLLYIGIGLFLYFLSTLLLRLTLRETTLATLYIATTTLAYLAMMAGGSRLSRLLHLSTDTDIFNENNETFPQEERKLTNEYSINLPAQYNLKGKTRKSWINIINPFRGLLVLGTPGSGKSYFVIREVIKQHIEKKFTFFLYDYKFPDLTRIAFNTLEQNRWRYSVAPTLYLINFDDLSCSHRCNLLSPETMLDITDATESSRTMLLALNRDWVRKTGDFFVESSINFITAIFWFLKKYENGQYCTLPHAIELAQIEYHQLFPVLSLEKEIEVLINPFISAYVNGATKQLESQIAGAKIALARLASPQLYYILSGNDFALDVNNPAAPKIVCVGNNPGKQQIYGAVLSLCIERMLKLVNRKGQLKSSLVFDEFPTLYVNNMDNLIATARGNKVATTLGVQDFSQLRKNYGREQAEVIMNVAGNIIAGQVVGDTARILSERIGKIQQKRESVSINSTDTSVNRSTQLDAAIPPSRIANLSSGEFVGAVADDPQQRIQLKAFHAEIMNDHAAIRREEARYQDLPVIRTVTDSEVLPNFYQIKQDIKNLIEKEMARIQSDPALKGLLEKIKPGQK